MKTNQLATILDALRKEVLASNFSSQPTTMSVTGLEMSEYAPIKATVKVNFAPLIISVED